MNKLTIFKWLGILEGISFLALFFISMPLKYWANIPEPNQVIGMAHGLLFIAYIYGVFWVKPDTKWNTKQTSLAIVAALLPFGTFYSNSKLL